MAHPYNDIRNHKVQKARVADITAACGGGMSAGGAADAVAKQKALYPAMKRSTLRADGGAVNARSDRPARAWGGRTGKKGGKKKSGHTVNVIVGAHPPGVAAPPPVVPPRPPMAPPGVAAGPPPGMPPRPMTPPPPGPMGGPPGVPGMPPGVQPPMLPRKRGGAVFSGNLKQNKVARGVVGSNKDDSKSAGAGKGRTPITRFFPSNKQDTPNIGRKAVITKATGGPIMSDSKAGVDMGPQFSGGSMGGIAKLEKMRRTKRSGYGGNRTSIKNPTQNPSPGSGRG